MNLKKQQISGVHEGMNVMLKEFSFRNCYSFKEEVVFSMEANNALKDNINFVISRGGTDNKVYLNPVAAIYGSNAGGKSNLLRALNDAVRNVYFGQELRNMSFYLTPKHDDTFMHKLVVVINDSEYEYQYIVNDSEVESETLYIRDLSEKSSSNKMVFERKGSLIDTSFLKEQAERQILTSVAANTRILVMKTVGEIGFDAFAPFYKWCGSVVSVMRVLGERERQDTLDKYASVLHYDKKKRVKFKEFMSAFDSSIGVVHTMKSSEGKTDDDDSTVNQEHRLFVGHRGETDTDGKPSIWLFPTEFESNGTKKLMELYPLLTEAIEMGTPLVCDELDTFLHPLIFKKIVAMFNDRKINNRGAQLIFSAHDTIVMNRECLRRDEISFVDKDADGKSSVFRLSDVTDEDGNKIRMDARYDRLYIDGILGATPSGFHNVKV